jgi:hypothetical protein
VEQTVVLLKTNTVRLKWLYIIFRGFNISWIGFCILTIELTLKENHMQGVLATSETVGLPSQLIPMLIGVFSFARVLWLIYKDFYRSWRAKSAAEQHHHGIFSLVPDMPDHVGPNRDLPKHGVAQDSLMYKNTYLKYVWTWLPWLEELVNWHHSSLLSTANTPRTQTWEHGVGFGTKSKQPQLEDDGKIC